MDTSRSLLLILAGVLATAGTLHALIFVRNAGLRDHLWLGAMALAAGAAVLAYAMAPAGPPSPLVVLGRGVAVVPSLAWLVAAMSLSVVLAVVLAATWTLAGTVAKGRLASQRQKQELAHASRLSIVGELTASIAHEINQPLGAILSNADAGEILLEGSDPPLDEIRRILADIRRDGLRASDVIRHVRALVRKRDMALERVDANALVSDVAALLAPEARRRRIVMTVEPRGAGAYLGGDRALMEQVLINLVLNAMDATEEAAAADGSHPGRRPIRLRVALAGQGDVQLTVVDSGQGIPTGQLKELFTSFYTSKPHGMGLGLSIARSIVEAHGGRIRAENNPVAGARFSITLPPYREAVVPPARAGRGMAPAPAPIAQPAAGGAVPGARAPRRRILAGSAAETGATWP